MTTGTETILWKAELQKLPLQSKLQWSHSLQRFNTMRVGGNTACFINVTCLDDLSRLLPFINHHQVPWFIIGKGSNLLLSDEEWPGIILRLTSEFKFWKPIENTNEVHVGAGLADSTFALRCVPLGWAGMEFLIGIPGNIGGAVAMNAGAHGGEIKDFLKKVWWVDQHGELCDADANTLDFSYRHSPLNGRFGTIITSALFRLNPSDPDTVKATMEKYKAFREEKQPRNIPNCGSVFKNPPGHYAAQLIESANLKGYSIGNAQVSTLHSNFIVNRGGATTQDILDLIQLIQEEVWKCHHVALEPEVEIVTYDH